MLHWRFTTVYVLFETSSQYQARYYLSLGTKLAPSNPKFCLRPIVILFLSVKAYNLYLSIPLECLCISIYDQHSTKKKKSCIKKS